LSNEEPPTSLATSSLVAQGYRESWRLYRQSLESPPGVWPHWDWIVLTAGDDRQARAFELQIEWRRKAGLLPRATRFAVVADPQGRRVGSGGATLHALGEVARRLTKKSRLRGREHLAAVFSWKRVLILHSGGESCRLPHCSAFGKVFGRVPRELPDGRVSTLFDEFLISLSGLPFRMHDGVFVASGDVLLLFDHRQLDLSRQGVVGIAARAPAELGARHGVYIADPTSNQVRHFLHKMSLPDLQAAGAIDASGDVAIDTGMVWFDPSTVAMLLAFFGLGPQLEFSEEGRFSEILTDNATLNLYSDLLMPLATETEREGYLADPSDGPPTPVIQRLRPLLWETLRGVPFHAQPLSPAEFIHIGTTREYLTAMVEGLERHAALDWKPAIASLLGSNAETQPSSACQPAAGNDVVLDSLVSGRTSGGNGCVIEDCFLGNNVVLGNRCLLSHVWTAHPITLGAGVVVHQLPVVAAEDSKQQGFVSRVYGIEDDPKRHFEDPAATFLNRPWAEWLREAALRPEQIWGKANAEERSLWTAQLFPLAATREESLALSLWLQNPASAGEEIRRQWFSAQRFSLEESAHRADLIPILEDLKRLDDLVRVGRFHAAVVHEQPSAQAMAFFGHLSADIRRRATAAAEQFARSPQPMLAMRGFKALADALLAQQWNKGFIELGRRYENRAFAILARAICEATPKPTKVKPYRRDKSERSRRAVVLAPARIDFAGGWSDTPPFSIEYGGAVLNAAIRLRGRLPISVECEVLDRPVLIFESRDLDVSREFDRSDMILHYTDPSDPLALHKAAVVLSGLVRPGRRQSDNDLAQALGRALGGGLRISTQVALPHGSGLGTSSILAGALLACLKTILGCPIQRDAIFDEVLCLEQMLTTGGGWQDQVGGMVGGIKLATTQPGLPQRVHIEEVHLRSEVANELRQRLVLVYTGQRRLAKGILRAITGRFMSRDPEVVEILLGIRDIAKAQRLALEKGDLDAMGRLMLEHWEMNKRMDPGTTNPAIDSLFQVCAPYMSGAKLAGAGGGGFMELIARDEKSPVRLAEALAHVFPSTDVTLWPCEIATDGLVFEY